MHWLQRGGEREVSHIALIFKQTGSSGPEQGTWQIELEPSAMQEAVPGLETCSQSAEFLHSLHLLVLKLQ